MNVNFLNGKVVLSYNGSKVKNSTVQLRSGFPNFKEGISIPYYLYLERYFFYGLSLPSNKRCYPELSGDVRRQLKARVGTPGWLSRLRSDS